MKQSLIAALICAGLTWAPLSAYAAPAATPTDSPAKVAARSTAIAVSHEGPDSTGSRLATRLKENLNSSSLFQLTEKDTPKIYIMLSTAPEFSSRPAVGSVYSLIWTFKQRDGQLAFLLAKDVGTVSDPDIDDLVARIIERTDGLSVKYEYLWKQ